MPILLYLGLALYLITAGAHLLLLRNGTVVRSQWSIRLLWGTVICWVVLFAGFGLVDGWSVTSTQRWLWIKTKRAWLSINMEKGERDSGATYMHFKEMGWSMQTEMEEHAPPSFTRNRLSAALRAASEQDENAPRVNSFGVPLYKRSPISFAEPDKR